jgi:hypothetical protein
MNSWQRNGIVVVAVLAFGAARMPYEAAVTRDLRAAGLTEEPISIGALDKVDQTGWAVALGGLRTLVATFLNLRAFGFFEDQNWSALEDTYGTMVDLAPHSSYYWDSGAWHMSTNESSYYVNFSDLPGLRRQQAWKASILRGRAFLERGIRNNPDDATLYKSLGNLLSDDFRYPAFGDPDKTFAEAAAAYHAAAATGKARGQVVRAEALALARVKGKEAEALKLLQHLYEDPHNRVPTLSVMLVVLEAYQHPEMDTAKRAVEIFGTPEKAYEAFKNHWLRTRGRYPVYGVTKALESLETTLKISPENSVFARPR